MFRFEEMFSMKNASVSYRAGIISLFISVLLVLTVIISSIKIL